ncbi:hypothetical protein BJX68DRAFT_266792 [Aspergillus pseudodeflectus]|uniref:Tautomerase cis-CaaD-like domain-containing protein n=1 Tax=Aspergillus pseudodeflectus TaxID=176178 RepID=A0ABR4KCJ6_9EURO
MPSLTKFWLFTLKDPSQDPSTLTPLLTEILELCSSFTNPHYNRTSSPENDNNAPTHAFYTIANKPSHMLMITGYPSQELNNEADKAYAEKFLPRLFEHVQHIWLRQIEVDIHELPVGGEGVVVSVDEGVGGEEDEPVGERFKEGKGGWDVWKNTRQGSEGDDVVQGARKGEAVGERVWVHVRGWDGEEEVGGPEFEGRSVLYSRKLVER